MRDTCYPMEWKASSVLQPLERCTKNISGGSYLLAPGGSGGFPSPWKTPDTRQHIPDYKTGSCFSSAKFLLCIKIWSAIVSRENHALSWPTLRYLPRTCEVPRSQWRLAPLVSLGKDEFNPPASLSCSVRAGPIYLWILSQHAALQYRLMLSVHTQQLRDPLSSHFPVCASVSPFPPCLGSALREGPSPPVCSSRCWINQASLSGMWMIL